jgi:outer membrane immunogenic protein
MIGAVMAPALAADVYDYPPASYGAPLASPPPQLYSFAGWYFGATAGYGSADFSTSRGDVSAGGAMGGGLLGWNWQEGPIVIGLEGDILAADVSGSRRGMSPTIDWMTDLRARAGVTVTPQVLLFATLGIAWADIDLPVRGRAARDAHFFGWSVGGGAEVALSQNWSARFDYQFTDFGSETVSYPGGPIKYDPDVNTYRGSLIYRF